MSETPDHTTDPIGPVATVPPSLPADPVFVQDKPNRLYQIAAWVAIVAGSLFIIAVVFFSGFILGRNSDGGGHFKHHRGPDMMFERGGPPMSPGGPGQGHMWPGPGNFGPGQPPIQPGQPPTPTR